MAAPAPLPRTLGELRSSEQFGPARIAERTVRDELRENIICALRQGHELFPGVLGYSDSVIPQVINAILSKQTFILLGLRGQAKSRILRGLTAFMDPHLPYLAGTEVHDNPYNPISRQGRLTLQEQGDEAEIAYLTPDERYIEKLATPDVTIADMIGDIDPIKAAKGARQLSDELNMHFGLLPRANRGIFAINELPDLMGKIQVGLFNILQEGDIQIKGYPVRLNLDTLLVFTANPEDYTARGKIVTPLKDRIGAEIRTHAPLSVDQAMSITAQEAWTERSGSGLSLKMPPFVAEIIERIAFLAREDSKIDQRSGVSQRMPISCLENVISNAERRAILCDEAAVTPRISDIYTSLPAITGKLELEYEGEMRGGEIVARQLIRDAAGACFESALPDANAEQVVTWFDMGGSLAVGDSESSEEALQSLASIQGLIELAAQVVPNQQDDPAMLVAAAEFVLEGLHAARKISRDEGVGYSARKPSRRERRRAQTANDFGDDFGGTYQ